MMEPHPTFIKYWDTFNLLHTLSKGKEEREKWITLNITNIRKNWHRPNMYVTEQVSDIVVDKISSNYPRDADNVKTLIAVCMHANE